MHNSQGFWSLLLGSDTYSTRRAKWFYEKAESIFNITIKIILLLGVFFLVFSFAMDPYIGFFQLFVDVVVIFFLVIFVIFNKLLFMAVGALIRIGELLENNSMIATPSYRPTPTPTPFPQKQTSKEPSSSNPNQEESNAYRETSTSASQDLSDPEKEKFESLRIEASKKITSKGHSISMQGIYPMNKWEITYKNGKIKRISNIDELVAASLES